MQCDLGRFNAALANAIENFGSEVEAGGGGGDRSALVGVDGLIAVAVVGRVSAVDVGRKWNMADAVESGEEIIGGAEGIEADGALAEFAAGENFGLQVVVLAEK